MKRRNGKAVRESKVATAGIIRKRLGMKESIKVVSDYSHDAEVRAVMSALQGFSNPIMEKEGLTLDVSPYQSRTLNINLMDGSHELGFSDLKDYGLTDNVLDEIKRHLDGKGIRCEIDYDSATVIPMNVKRNGKVESKKLKEGTGCPYCDGVEKLIAARPNLRPQFVSALREYAQACSDGADELEAAKKYLKPLFTGASGEEFYGKLLADLKSVGAMMESKQVIGESSKEEVLDKLHDMGFGTGSADASMFADNLADELINCGDDKDACLALLKKKLGYQHGQHVFEWLYESKNMNESNYALANDNGKITDFRFKTAGEAYAERHAYEDKGDVFVVNKDGKEVDREGYVMSESKRRLKEATPDTPEGFDPNNQPSFDDNQQSDLNEPDVSLAADSDAVSIDKLEGEELRDKFGDGDVFEITDPASEVGVYFVTVNKSEENPEVIISTLDNDGNPSSDHTDDLVARLEDGPVQEARVRRHQRVLESRRRKLKEEGGDPESIIDEAPVEVELVIDEEPEAVTVSGDICDVLSALVGDQNADLMIAAISGEEPPVDEFTADHGSTGPEDNANFSDDNELTPEEVSERVMGDLNKVVEATKSIKESALKWDEQEGVMDPYRLKVDGMDALAICSALDKAGIRGGNAYDNEVGFANKSDREKAYKFFSKK